MKKLSYILIGMAVGVALTLSSNAYSAVTSLVGKKVTSEVPIMLDGKPVEVKGSVASGTTLLPVRDTAKLFGAKVEYKNGTVYLTSPKPASGAEQ